MASPSETVGGESGPEISSGGVRAADRSSMMESTFILIELGKLTSHAETSTRILEKLSDKLDKLAGKVAELDDASEAARIVGSVLVGVVTMLAGAFWWLAAALWPARQKLTAVLLG